MSDLVKRLRAPMWTIEPSDIRNCAHEAADRIERLEEALREVESVLLIEHALNPNYGWKEWVANTVSVVLRKDWQGKPAEDLKGFKPHPNDSRSDVL